MNNLAVLAINREARVVFDDKFRGFLYSMHKARPEPIVASSVGWLVVDDKVKKVPAPNMGDLDDASNMQMSEEIVIPISCVLRVSRLNEVTSSSREHAALKPKRLRF